MLFITKTFPTDSFSINAAFCNKACTNQIGDALLTCMHKCKNILTASEIGAFGGLIAGCIVGTIILNKLLVTPATRMRFFIYTTCSVTGVFLGAFVSHTYATNYYDQRIV